MGKLTTHYMHYTVCPSCGRRQNRGATSKRDERYKGCSTCGFRGELNTRSQPIVVLGNPQGKPGHKKPKGK